MIVPDLFDYATRIHYRMPEVDMPGIASRRLSQLAETQEVHIFTDGSCQNPSSITTRFASYAIVADISTAPQSRRSGSDQFLVSGRLPDTLVPIAAERVHGRQNIHRAELLAITLATALPKFRLHTDSQVALAAWALACTRDPKQFANHAEFDLVLRLSYAIHPTHQISEIKAHEDLQAVKDLDVLYQHLGNKVANDVAIHTNRHANGSFAKDLEAQVKASDNQKQQYNEVLRYILALNFARAKACTQHHTIRGNRQTVNEEQTPIQMMNNWQPENFWQPCIFTEEQCSLLNQCAWAHPVAQAVVSFFSSCTWPTDSNGEGYNNIGISWIEIAVGIMLHLQAFLPLVRTLSDGESHLVHPGSESDLQTFGATLVEMSTTASRLTEQVRKLLPGSLSPSVERGRVKSMYILGESQYCQGFMTRPSYDLQETVLSACEGYVRNNREFPKLIFENPREQLRIEDSLWIWNDRCKRARKAMAVARTRASAKEH